MNFSRRRLSLSLSLYVVRVMESKKNSKNLFLKKRFFLLQRETPISMSVKSLFLSGGYYRRRRRIERERGMCRSWMCINIQNLKHLRSFRCCCSPPPLLCSMCLRHRIISKKKRKRFNTAKIFLGYCEIDI